LRALLRLCDQKLTYVPASPAPAKPTLPAKTDNGGRCIEIDCQYHNSLNIVEKPHSSKLEAFNGDERHYSRGPGSYDGRLATASDEVLQTTAQWA
jgi:hypothetical protein